METMRLSCFVLILLFCRDPLSAQNNWELKKNKEGIKISTRPSTRSAFNDISVEMDLPGNIYQLAAILMDADQYTKWSYSVEKSKVVKKISPYSFVYYMEINAPWPVTNRDLYAEINISLDSIMQSMKVYTKGSKDFRPPGHDLVRIPYSNSIWSVNTVSNHTIHLIYVLEIDPGGSVPGWIMNLFSTKAPFETFKNLKRKMTLLNPGI
jgi:hypothetical protein